MSAIFALYALALRKYEIKDDLFTPEIAERIFLINYNFVRNFSTHFPFFSLVDFPNGKNKLIFLASKGYLKLFSANVICQSRGRHVGVSFNEKLRRRKKAILEGNRAICCFVSTCRTIEINNSK